MGKVALTGNDTIKLGGRIITDLADGDAVTFEFPNQVVEMQKGKNKNAIYAFNSTGTIVNVTYRVLLGSADDKFLNGLLAVYRLDPPSFALLRGEFIKRVGDGEGGVNNVIYKVSGGVVSQYPGASENTQGTVEQSVAVWQVTFANNERIIE